MGWIHNCNNNYNSDNNNYTCYDDIGKKVTHNVVKGNDDGTITLIAYRLKTNSDDEYKKVYNSIDTLSTDINNYIKEIKEPKNIIELICDILDD